MRNEKEKVSRKRSSIDSAPELPWMKRPGIIVCPLLLAVTTCAAIDLTTFRTDYAHHSLFDWNARLGASGRTTTDSLGGEQAKYLSASGRAEWTTRTESDDLVWSLLVPLRAGYSAHAVTTQGDSFISSTGHRVSAVVEPELEALGYEPGTDLFIRAALDGGLVLKRDRKSNGYRLDIQKSSAHGEVGLGWGRIRDAWPLRKAVYIAQVLSEENILDRDLTDSELLDIAAFLSRSWKLFLAHQRPARFYYDSLSSLLARTGATRGPLPARAIMRLDEDLYVGSFERRSGWRVSVSTGFEGDLYCRQETEEDSSWSRMESEFGFRPVAWLEYARPVGTRWVFEGALRYGPEWDKENHDWFHHELILSLTAKWQVLDRLELALVPSLQTYYSTWRNPGFDPTLKFDHEIDLTCSYYLAERLRIVGNLEWWGRWFQYFSPHPTRPYTQNEWTLDLGLHWGRLPAGWGVRYY